MDKRKIRDSIRLFGSICFFWLYIPLIPQHYYKYNFLST